LSENIKSEGCKAIFSTLNVDPQKYLDGLNTPDYQNGTESQLRIEDIVSVAYARATGTLGWTVADLFKNGFPGGSTNLQINGWTPPGGDIIFLRPGGITAELLGHENFHKFGLYDSDLLRKEWGLDPNGPSSQFSDYFKKKCLK
jgi:hypothetical protein